MKLKKLFAGILAAAMMATMAAPAFATEADPGVISVSKDPVTEVTLTKTYNVSGDTTQAETFEFTLTGSSVTNSSVKEVPTIDSDATKYEVSFGAISEDQTGNFTIDLSKLNITRTGVYNYTIHEKNEKATPGVTYDANDVTMKVTAVNDSAEDGGLVYYVALYKAGKKINAANAFVNSYDAHKLSIKKTVKGNFGDHDKYFEFTVKLTGTANKTYAPVTAALETADPDNKSVLDTIAVDGQPHTFYLKHNQTLNILNLPDDVTYEVAEVGANTKGFEYTVTTKDISNKMTQDWTAEIENKREGTVDTGVILDTAPYLLVLVGVFAAAGVMLINKRRHFED